MKSLVLCEELNLLDNSLIVFAFLDSDFSDFATDGTPEVGGLSFRDDFFSATGLRP